jgi:hypothetical protein
MKPKSPITDILRARAMELAAREEGVSPGDFEPEHRAAAGRLLWRLAFERAGGLFRGGNGRSGRYFTTQERADNFTVSFAEVSKERARVKRREAKARCLAAKREGTPKKARPGRGKAITIVGKPTAGISIPTYTGKRFEKGSLAVNEGKVKPIVCPSHPGYDPRYSLPPGAVVRGEFSRIPLGGTLE